jgi:hypothetical protein
MALASTSNSRTFNIPRIERFPSRCFVDAAAYNVLKDFRRGPEAWPGLCKGTIAGRCR